MSTKIPHPLCLAFSKGFPPIPIPIPFPRKLSASLHVPTTVAFAAPGIHHAARVLLGQLHQELHNKLESESLTTLTVQPAATADATADPLNGVFGVRGRCNLHGMVKAILIFGVEIYNF